ncbi:type IV secretory system conjugative DNA transfer family protein [Desulfovibrio sp. OttesenSCG-928-F07]|nr:type IV secretory system conjugative DNA transfer family protein [Desulfovibrio sp. OttesenSCG-928-F07]
MKKQYGLADSTKQKKRFALSICFPLLLAFLFGQAATQYLAHKAGYALWLGKPVFVYDFLHIYWPWQVIFWKNAFHPELYNEALRLGLLAACVPLIPLVARFANPQKGKSIADLHGSAHWAKVEEIQSMSLLDGAGVYIGAFARTKHKTHYLRHNGPEHILCFAPTRSGKGVGLILPTLLSWSGSALVFDIKGENFALTSGYRKNILGQAILRFDPADSSGNGVRFNPLEEIRLDTSLAIPDVQNVAMMLIDPDGKGLQDHWAKAGFAFLAGTLLHVLVKIRYEQKRSATLTDLCLALAAEESTLQELYEEMLETDHVAILQEVYQNYNAADGSAVHTFVATSAREMLNKPENEAGSVVSSALVNIALYRDPVVAHNTSACDFRVHDLMNHDTPVSLYLVVSPADADRLKPLIRLVINIIMRRATEKMEFAGGTSVAGYKHRLLMMLDEFTALGKLEIMERAIAFCAGYGVKLYIIVQDITQLNAVYGKDNALMANCHVRIAYAPNTIETAKVLSDMCGKTTIIQDKKSISGGSGKKSTSESIQEIARPLLTPDECMRLPAPHKNSSGQITAAGDMLIFVAGQNPIYGKQILYFKDDVFMARAKIPAPAESDKLTDVAKKSEEIATPVIEPVVQQPTVITPTKTFEDYLNS